MEQEKIDNRIEQLKYIFENVNSWLHFAEAKNGALIAFNVALLSVLFTREWTNVSVFTLIVIFILISTGFSLFSFKPLTKSIPKCQNKNIEKNLLYCGYISSLELEDYMRALYKDYWNEPHFQMERCANMERELCSEIIQNSRILMRKQKLFERAFYVDICALVTVVILLVLA